jgi:pimeloyl-ACP methyl ester carboxylesterase
MGQVVSFIRAAGNRRLTDVHIFILDLPGHSKSVRPGCQSVADNADHVIGFMDVADLIRAVFIGHTHAAQSLWPWLLTTQRM